MKSLFRQNLQEVVKQIFYSSIYVLINCKQLGRKYEKAIETNQTRKLVAGHATRYGVNSKQLFAMVKVKV